MVEPELHPPEVFRQYTPKTEGVLYELEREAQAEDIPIVGPHVGKILSLLVKITGARRILELGTANAYSTIWIALSLVKQGRSERDFEVAEEENENQKTSSTTIAAWNNNPGKIITLEWDPEMAKEARNNIDRVGLSELIEVVEGDARDYMSSLGEDEKFDLVFLDVEKEYYSDLLEPVINVTRSGGLLVFDNTAFRSAGDFLRLSYDHPQLETIHLYGFYPDHNPDFDALTLCLKK